MFAALMNTCLIVGVGTLVAQYWYLASYGHKAQSIFAGLVFSLTTASVLNAIGWL